MTMFSRFSKYTIPLYLIASFLLVVVAVKAATTIGTNISTDGTLSVTGTASLTTASTTDDFWLGNQTADDDDSLFMDASSSEYVMWDDSPGQFQLSDDLLINGNASSTGYFVVGATQPTNNMAAGDVLVGGNATTTGDLVVSGGDLNKDGTGLTLGGKATSTAFVVGTETTAATTTIKIKTDGSAAAKSCLEMVNTSDGAIYRVFLNGTAFMIQAGACN